MNEDFTILNIISKFLFAVLSNTTDHRNTQDGDQQSNEINDIDIDQEIAESTSQCVATSTSTTAASSSSSRPASSQSSRPASSLSIASTSSGTGSRPPSRVRHLSSSSDSGPSKRSRQQSVDEPSLTEILRVLEEQRAKSMSELQAQMLQQQKAMFENMTAMLTGIVQQFQPPAQTMPPPARTPTPVARQPRPQGMLAPQQLAFGNTPQQAMPLPQTPNFHELQSARPHQHQSSSWEGLRHQWNVLDIDDSQY